MDTIRNRCLPINLSLARAQIRIHPPTVRDSERNRLQGSSWLPQGQMRCAISEILGLTSSKKSASPRSVASWPGKYGYPSLACGDRVTQVTTTAEGLTHQHPRQEAETSRASPPRSPAAARPRRGGGSRGPCRGGSAKKRPWRRQWWWRCWRGAAASLLLGSGRRGGRGRRRWRAGTRNRHGQRLVMTRKPSSFIRRRAGGCCRCHRTSQRHVRPEN